MIPQLTPAAVAAALAGESPPVLLDVRTRPEFEIAAIAGAVLVPMHEIAERIDELDPDASTVVVCHHGVRSQRVAMFLTTRGFDDVSNLSGGIERWSLEVDPGVPRY